MQNWWRNLLGLPSEETLGSGTESDRVVPAAPRRKGGNPSDAVHDFLSGWLVEQKPEEAIAYLAEQSYACVYVQTKPATDRGVVSFLLLQRMMAANAQFGKMSSLSDAVVGVAVSSERLKVIQQPHHSTFVLYNVREDLAEEFKCVNRLDSSRVSPKALKSKSFGKYVGAMFTIKANQQTAARMVATLWQREGGYWKLISYDVESRDRSKPRTRWPCTRSPRRARRRRAVGICARREGYGQGCLEFHEGVASQEECREGARVCCSPSLSRASRSTVQTMSRPRRRPRRRAICSRRG